MRLRELTETPDTDDPEVFWDKYKDQPKELRAREDAIAKSARR